MKYRNASPETQTLMNHGVVLPGEAIEVTGEVENPNFVAVAEEFRPVEATAPVAPTPVHTAPVPDPVTTDEQPNN
jgi:hypothetical protein